MGKKRYKTEGPNSGSEHFDVKKAPRSNRLVTKRKRVKFLLRKPSKTDLWLVMISPNGLKLVRRNWPRTKLET